jgi:purine nucleosidase
MKTSLTNITDARRLALLEPPAGRVRMVLDTDTYNEIDDQFAVVYALLSGERIDVEAIYAAPFHNDRSTGPADGMNKSYDEILRVLDRLGYPSDGFVHRGSTEWLMSLDRPVESPAALDLVERARGSDPSNGPLYVVAIGAITNVASAILMAPEIADRIVVVWLSGHPYTWHEASDFNTRQDMVAAGVILDCGVPHVRVPCCNVAEHLKTTVPEMERFVKGRGAIGDYLYQIFADYHTDHFAWSKEIWDVGPVAWLVNPDWVPSVVIHSPVLTSEHTWSHDPTRHLAREAIRVKRDLIFGDMFRKIEKHGSSLPAI